MTAWIAEQRSLAARRAAAGLRPRAQPRRGRVGEPEGERNSPTSVPTPSRRSSRPPTTGCVASAATGSCASRSCARPRSGYDATRARRSARRQSRCVASEHSATHRGRNALCAVSVAAQLSYNTMSFARASTWVIVDIPHTSLRLTTLFPGAMAPYRAQQHDPPHQDIGRCRRLTGEPCPSPPTPPPDPSDRTQPQDPRNRRFGADPRGREDRTGHDRWVADRDGSLRRGGARASCVRAVRCDPARCGDAWHGRHRRRRASTCASRGGIAPDPPAHGTRSARGQRALAARCGRRRYRQAI